MYLENLPVNPNLSIEFNPSGVYKEKEGIFALTFEFKAQIDKSDLNLISIRCVALFEFKDKILFNDIPDYFYSNIIAILFPSVRAFVNTISFQANFTPIIIPTLNLSSLK